MKSIICYLDELKEKAGSDYKAAQMLGISKVSVSQIRKRGSMADETAIKLAELIGVDQDEVLLSATLARSDGAVKTAWERISRRAGIAASVALALIMTSGFSVRNEAVNNVHYAKSGQRRGFCVRAISFILESILWHVRKALSIIPAGTVAA